MESPVDRVSYAAAVRIWTRQILILFGTTTVGARDREHMQSPEELTDAFAIEGIRVLHPLSAATRRITPL
jgi:hypothetical protein